MLEKNLARFVLPRDLKLLEIKALSRGYLWRVEKVRQCFEICPKCATPSNVRAGKANCIVRDESLRDQPIYLQINKHRYFCKTCKKSFTEPVSITWPRRRTTNRFRKALAKDCDRYTNLARVKREHRVSNGLLYQVYYEQITIKLRERKNAPWPEVLGIDEHFFNRSKGYSEFVTVFTDLKKKRLFEVALSKNNRSLIEQVANIAGRENVRVVAIDLSSGYKALVQKLFPNAKIVADKFHVLRLLSPAIMSAGKKLHGHRQELKTRRKLLCNRSKLDYFVRSEIDRYLHDKTDLKNLYRFKEKMFELYRTKGYDRARKKLNELIEELKMQTLEPLLRLARTLQRWRNEVLLYFKNRRTNAFTEAMNNVGKLLQRRACGYKSFKNYRLAVLNACAF